jgi:hypothetical protein
MTDAKKPAEKAAPEKGAAARSETDDGPRTIEFEGITLELPRELPSALLFDLVEVEASAGEINEYIVNLRILRSLVGKDQFIEIRHKIGDDVSKVMGLMEAVLDQFGLTLGESSASPGS